LKTEISQKVLFVPFQATQNANNQLFAGSLNVQGLTEKDSRKASSQLKASTIFTRMSCFLGASSLLIAPLCDQSIATRANVSIANSSISAPVRRNSEDINMQQLRQGAAAMRGQYNGTDAGFVEPQMVAQRSKVTQWSPSLPRYSSTGTNSNGIMIPVPAPRTYAVPAAAAPQRQPQVATGSFNYPAGDRVAELIWPARGSLSSRYGRRWGRMHQGIDIAGPIGTPIVAAADGVVIASGYSSGGYGNVVDIEHPDGSVTRYGHNSRLLVGVGQQVKQGQNIAEMGSTGRSTGPHLHFEFHPSGGQAVNPMAYLPSSAS
jgi:murein DD-endopeptidase MepM/ murein hydrolase activator NlpD